MVQRRRDHRRTIWEDQRLGALVTASGRGLHAGRCRAEPLSRTPRPCVLFGIAEHLVESSAPQRIDGAFVRRLNRTEEERQADELARTVNAIASQVAALTTLPAAEARPRAVWNVLVHGEGNH